MLALNNRVHLFAHPSVQDELTEFFANVLGCGPPLALDVPGLIAFAFPNGGSLSIEFTEDALDEGEARGGAWLELVADDAARVRERLVAAGTPRLEYLGNEYFQAPGGQVLRIAPA